MQASKLDTEETNWLGVIGRALAFLCLSQADLRDKAVAPQAQFLEGLGISRREAAKMLGTTEDVLRVSINRAKQQKRGPNGGKKRTRSR